MQSLILKTIAASFISLGIFLGVIFIFGNRDPLNVEIAKSQNRFRFESVSELLSSRKKISTGNTTRELAAELASELIAQNPEGPRIEGSSNYIAALDPNMLAEKVINEAFSKLTVDDLRPRIDLDSLIIIKTKEKKAIEGYFNEINRIIVKYFPQSLSLDWANPSQANFSVFLSAFDGAGSELRTLAAPQPVAKLHQNLLELLGAQRNTIATLQNYEIDPAQATIAIEAGERFTAELELVFDAMDTYINNNQLTLASY